MNVEQVCTHAHLDAELKGKLDRLLPATYQGSTVRVREEALRRVLQALSRRTPPILEGDISVPSELRDAVLFVVAEELYREAITSPESPHAIQWKVYRDRANAELSGLMPTLTGDARGAAFSFSLERR
jgi:hypothetical protein